MNNFIGIVVSFAYFFGLLIASQYMPFKTLEGKRKFVHIMLGNWWLLVIAFFSNVFAAMVVPVSFIFINYLSLKRDKENGLLSSLERKNQKSYGIVLYPVAMSILIWMSFSVWHDMRIGGIGLIALSYGDGIAALTGKHFKYGAFKIFGNKKTISGSLGMLVSTFSIALIYMYVTNLVSIEELMLVSFSVAMVSTVAEAITPFGIDDITVPVSAVVMYCIFRS